MMIMELKSEQQIIQRDIQRFRDDENELKEYNKRIKFVKKRIEDLRYSKDALNQILEMAKNRSLESIEYLVSCVLKEIKGEEYSFHLKTKTIRNKPAIEAVIKIDGEEYSLEDTTGDGIQEIIAFVCRLALWKVSVLDSKGIFILDEPFRHLNIENVAVMMNFLKQFSEENNVQFIITTHNPLIASFGEKVYKL